MDTKPVAALEQNDNVATIHAAAATLSPLAQARLRNRGHTAPIVDVRDDFVHRKTTEHTENTESVPCILCVLWFAPLSRPHRIGFHARDLCSFVALNADIS